MGSAVYMLTHPARLCLAALGLLVVFAGAARAGALRSLLPAPLRGAQVGAMAVDADGALVVERISWAGEIAGAWVAVEVPRARLRLPAAGAEVERLVLMLDLDDVGGGALAETLAPGGTSGASRLRSLVDRVVREVGRFGALTGPVHLTSATIVLVRRGEERARWDLRDAFYRPSRPHRARLRGTVSVPAQAASDVAEETAAIDLEVRWDEGAPLEVSCRAEGRLLALLARGMRLPAGVLFERHGVLETHFELTPSGPLTLRGRVRADALTVENSALAGEPVRFEHVSGGFVASADLEGERVVMHTSDGRIGSARLDAMVSLARRSRSWQVDARLDLPEQPCRELIGGLPEGLLGDLRGARWRGEAGFSLVLSVNTARPRRLRLTMDGDAEGCRADTLGRDFDRRLDRLAEPFLMRIEDPSGAASGRVEIGPRAAGYLTYDKMPRLLTLAAVATEDRGFFRHNGVSLGLIQGALRLDLEKGRFFYGGSTITQQLVKNLLLSRTKTIARKVQELLLAREMERRLTKERILELYLNCIEYGPGVYGLTAAARFYFGKDPRSLTPLETAFLMGLKPSPRTGFMVFRRGELNPRWRLKMKTILGRLVKLGVLEEEDVLAEAPYQPAFRPYDPAVHRSYPSR